MLSGHSGANVMFLANVELSRLINPSGQVIKDLGGVWKGVLFLKPVKICSSCPAGTAV